MSEIQKKTSKRRFSSSSLKPADNRAPEVVEKLEENATTNGAISANLRIFSSTNKKFNQKKNTDTNESAIVATELKNTQKKSSTSSSSKSKSITDAGEQSIRSTNLMENVQAQGKTKRGANKQPSERKLQETEIDVNFNLRNDDIESKACNYISLNLQEKLSTLSNARKCSFKGNLRMTDCILWKIAVLTSTIADKRLKTLDCTACVHLTDGAVFCVASTFQNLEKISFDACDKITERSVITVAENLKKLKVASFRACNVKILPLALLNEKKFDFTGCPVVWLKSMLTDTKESRRKYKVVVIHDQPNNNDDIKSNSLISYLSTESFNVIECNYKIASNFATPGSIFVLVSEDKAVVESSLHVVANHADGSPIIVLSSISSLVSSIKAEVEKTLTEMTTRFDHDMNFVQQQLYGNLKKLDYYLKRMGIIPVLSISDLKDYKSSAYANAISFIDKYFPEQQMLKSFNQRNLTKFLTEQCDAVNSEADMAKLHLLLLQGSIVTVNRDSEIWYYSIELLSKCINKLWKFKNKDSNGKIIPCLPEDANSFYIFQQSQVLETFNLSNVKKTVVQNFLTTSFVIKIVRPWVNDIVEYPAAFLTSLLPPQPPVPLETLWQQFCTSEDMEIESAYKFVLEPHTNFFHYLLSVSCRFSQIVAIWASGAIFHYGCVEILLFFKPAEKTLVLGVRTGNIETASKTADGTTVKKETARVSVADVQKYATEEGKEDNETTKMTLEETISNAQANFEKVLVSTFQLFRQFIITTTLSVNLFVKESIKCPECASKQKLHYLDINFNNDFTCTVHKTVFPQSTFGLDKPYAENLCAHYQMKACALTQYKRCVRCGERFENMVDEFWCDADSDICACFTCTHCLCILAEQNALLNELYSNDANKTNSDLANNGFLYEVEQGPISISKEIYETDFWPIRLVPLNVKGIILITKIERFNLIDFCPNNETIHITAIVSDTGTIGHRFHSSVKSFIYTGPVFNWQFLFTEKPSSLIIRSTKRLDLNISTIQIGMCLELTESTDPSKLCIGVIKDFEANGRMKISLKNEKEMVVSASVIDENVHPVCYCASVKKDLIVFGETNKNDILDAKNEMKSIWTTKDDIYNLYGSYLERYGYTVVPMEYFTAKQAGEVSDKATVSNVTPFFLYRKGKPKDLEVYMILEAKDKRYPREKINFIAEIKEIKENSFILGYCDYEEEKDTTVEYKKDDSNLHPIGYSSFMNETLLIPAAMEFWDVDQTNLYFTMLANANKKEGVQNMCLPAKSRVSQKMTLNAAQTGGCPKHMVESSFYSDVDANECSPLSRCTNSMTMHKILCYANQHFIKLRDYYDNSLMYIYLPLSPDTIVEQHLRYPQRNLVHNFKNVKNHRLFTIVIQAHEVTDRLYRKDDNDIEYTITDCNLKSNEISTVADVISEKKNTNPTFFNGFYENHSFEIIRFISFVRRIKLNIPEHEFKTIFKLIKTLSPREVAEGMQRYSWLSIFTLLTAFSTTEKPLYQVESTMNYVSVFNVLSRRIIFEENPDESEIQLNEYKIPNNAIATLVEHYFDDNHTYNLTGSFMLSVIPLFRSLTYVNLHNCNLQEFDVDTTFLSHSLAWLTLDQNPLKIIPPCVFRLKELRSLSMNRCGIRDIPDEFDKLPKLNNLELDGNLIHVVPRSLSTLKVFQNQLSLNAINLYPPSIINHRIIDFDSFVSFAKMYYFPTFENKTNKEIQDILAEKCSLQSFNEMVPIEKSEDINRLNSLIASECPRFESAASTHNPKLGHGFPSEILNLQFVTVLNLSSHHISEIPPEINQMFSLELLNVSDCIYLENISEQIANNALKMLFLIGCSALKNPSLEIVNRGMESVFGYFHRCLAGSEIIRRTKLMMVGLGGAGKTKLVEALTSEELKASSSKSPDVTDGISLSTFYREVDSETTITFNIWDFAGQSVYYNTHQVNFIKKYSQFFLSNRAIYFLLWNSRLGYENSGLDFWLSTISCRAPKAPIFIIATNADIINHIVLPESELKANYPKIEYFAHISSITGQGIKELLDKLTEVTLAQPYMNQKIPSIFSQLEFEIYTKRFYDNLKIMPLNEIERMGMEVGLVTPQEVKEALTFLHDLCTIQYFPNGILKDYVIIEPQWLVDAMACLISVKESVIKDGRFMRSDISKIWSKYPIELHDFLLKLTEEFDLTFSIQNEDVNIVPCMLPDIEPPLQMMVVDNVKIFERKMIYKFRYFPAGLFNRIQSRLCQYSDGAKIWKRGSLLNKNNHLALLKQNRNNELRVTVQGSGPENVLFLIHEIIETLINDFFQGVDYDILIPCPDCFKEDSQNAHMFSVNYVKRACKLKAPFLQCSQTFHIVSMEILRGILPPSTMNDQGQQLSRMVQQLNDLRLNVTFDVCIICCIDNIGKDNQVSPLQIEQNLKGNNITCKIWKVSDDCDIDCQHFGLEIQHACLILICVSSEFCSSKNCIKMFSYVQQSKMQTMYAILGSSDNWKTNNFAQQIQNKIYFDFEKDLSKFETTFHEMLKRIKAKVRRNVAPIHHPPVFFSYCLANCAADAKQNYNSKEAAIGEVDPRCLAKELLDNDVDLWIDHMQLTRNQRALFEDIADALMHSKIFVACVSDEYALSKNCLMEYRFADAMVLPKIHCIFGKGDNWQKSEINFLALSASKYNFQSYSKDTLRNLLNRIDELLKSKISARPNRTNDKRRQSTESNKMANLSDMTAYQELGELVQRKILQQAIYVANKLKLMDASMGKPYPRIFFIDLQQIQTSKDSCAKDSTAKNNYTINGQTQAAFGLTRADKEKRTKNLFGDIRLRDLCIKWICEYEGGWHSTGESLTLRSFEEKYAGTLSDFLDKISLFEVQMLNLLQHSTVAIDLMQLTNFDHILKDLKQRAEDFGEDGFEISYRFLYRIVRQVDKDCTRGGMQQCCLFSKKIVWLCPEHQKFARSFLADDDFDTEDVTADAETTNDQPLSNSPVPYSNLSDIETLKTEHSSILRVPEVKPFEDILQKVETTEGMDVVIIDSKNMDTDISGKNTAQKKIGRKARSRLCILM